jgi:homogentisate 1,2-dioxygenase
MEGKLEAMELDSSEPQYLQGFGNEFTSEAISGALPTSQNSPQRCPFDLYAEQISGSSFTMPRGQNFRSWLYRIAPSVLHDPFESMQQNPDLISDFSAIPGDPNQESNFVFYCKPSNTLPETFFLNSCDGTQCHFPRMVPRLVFRMICRFSKNFGDRIAFSWQVNFFEGFSTIAGSGEPSTKNGVAIHMYSANTSMTDMAMYNSGVASIRV